MACLTSHRARAPRPRPFAPHTERAPESRTFALKAKRAKPRAGVRRLDARIPALSGLSTPADAFSRPRLKMAASTAVTARVRCRVPARLLPARFLWVRIKSPHIGVSSDPRSPRSPSTAGSAPPRNPASESDSRPRPPPRHLPQSRAPHPARAPTAARWSLPVAMPGRNHDGSYGARPDSTVPHAISEPAALTAEQEEEGRHGQVGESREGA